MVTGEIYGRTVSMQGGPFALVAYKREFGTDLMADAIEAVKGDAPDISALLQVAWAMAKTHDERTSAFPQWVREFDPREFTLGDTASTLGVIDSAMNAELFRCRATSRVRRWFGRRLDALAKYLGRSADGLLAR